MFVWVCANQTCSTCIPAWLADSSGDHDALASYRELLQICVDRTRVQLGLGREHPLAQGLRRIARFHRHTLLHKYRAGVIAVIDQVDSGA